MKKIFISVLLVVSFMTGAIAQTAAPAKPKFWSNIEGFRKQDSLQAPPADPIVFVGSSSFTIWQSMNKDFPEYPILNRGFGGSSLPDVIRYADEVIIKYHPKQVVIYCGDNDFANSPNVTAETVVQRFKTLYKMIRDKLPETTIDFVSIKPSPSRENLLPKMKAANAEIKKFLEGQQHAGYIDVFSAMIDENGKIKEELFRQDRLHMKRNGYELWIPIIKPYLLK
jgi:lysophospholipase L1-like esterase